MIVLQLCCQAHWVLLGNAAWEVLNICKYFKCPIFAGLMTAAEKHEINIE
jgi:hypothetical protein